MVRTKAAIRRRYDQLRTRESDKGSTDAERAKAKAAADKLRGEHPWLDEPETPPRDSASTSTPPPAGDTTVAWADLLVKGATAVASAWVADRVDHAARKADKAIDRIFGEAPMADKHPDRMSNAELVAKTEVAGAILPTGEDDEGDILAVVVLVDLDVANSIVDRSEDGASKLDTLIGRGVVAAIAGTLDGGEYGDWPFGDEDEDDE